MRTSGIIKVILFLFFIIICAGLAGVNLHALPGNKVSGENHALIIGINNYENWSKLKSPVKDAEEISKILTGKYNFKKSNVVLLTDNSHKKPTENNIFDSIESFYKKLTPNDNLLLFYSGHSAEDDKGDTYWIPIDAKKDSKRTWLKHSDLSEDFFAAENFKAKNLCIITDSLFSTSIIKKKSITLSPFDLRYEEKISEKSTRRSREVISFGDQHWEGDDKSGGIGLFTQYISNALNDNSLDIIDFENLIFDEEIIFPIRRIAGTKMIRGRLRNSKDKGGQFVIARVAPASIVDVLNLAVTPKKGYQGDKFTFEIKTSGPASEVFIEIGGRKHVMKGSGTDWKYVAIIDNLGNIPFSGIATNRNNAEGESLKNSLRTIKKLSESVNVASAVVNPKSGLGGDKYRFSAVTNSPAKSVNLLIGVNEYKMSGSGTKWSLDRTIEETGSVEFSMIALNADGITGEPGTGVLKLKAGPVNVVNIKTTPKTAYAGERFTITATTDRYARSASLKIDGKSYKMKGSGKIWSIKTQIPDIGKKEFSVFPKNMAGITGLAMSSSILTKKSPLPVPNVARADVSIVSPGKGHVGDKFIFKVETSVPSNKVFVDIEDESFAMKGSGTSWTYIASIDKVGLNQYTISAKNKDGVQGEAIDGSITTTKRPSRPVNVLLAEVSPKKGPKGKSFTFTANTDFPAKNVSLIIDKNHYPMKGSGKIWTIAKKLNKSGKINFSIVASNKDNVKGGIQKASVKVYSKRYKYNKDGTVTDQTTGEKRDRFLDNGDGTISDLATSRMWLKEPKPGPVTWEDSVEYCKSLSIKGYSGWRLPTIKELKTLVDKKRQNPALPAGHPFSNVQSLIYWSKTKKLGPQYSAVISMWTGKTGHQKKKETAIAWPIRYVDLTE
ncbi:MAG: DUF1566 domain-containing protein [Desulfobacterales bacterium]|nr:DUF1566 domain-containing protein [Desulfobacteraceae bacterium]MBT7698071.1 DUF1566 domain-containing protein [Desulfobacterales bacterium]